MPATRRTVFLWGACAALLALGQARAASVEEPAEESKDDEAPLRQLVVDPAAEPSPALQYRLLPGAWELKRGNAVVLYLRQVHAQGDVWKKLLDESAVSLSLPIEEFPRLDMHVYVDKFSDLYEQLEFAAIRDRAEWEYPIGEVPFVYMLLPDAGAMRRYARFVALKARLEIVEGRFDEAMRTLQTGMAMARHEAEAPFLVNSLVAVKMSKLMLERVEELIARPGAPNLYWALTKLPRPFVDFKTGFDFETQLWKLTFPELADLEKERAPEDWQALVNKIYKMATEMSPKDDEPAETARRRPINPSELIDKAYPDAKRFLIQTRGRSATEVEAMAAEQVVLLHMMANYVELRDEIFKWYTVPYWKSKAGFDKASQRLKEVMQKRWNPFVAAALPAVLGNVYPQQVGSERYFAALRVIEALRMYAAAHDRALPERLNQITLVPVPRDPMTGRAFEYRRDGEAALLTARAPEGLSAEEFGLRYRISIRAKGADADSK